VDVPDRLLPHTITVIHPTVTTNEYGTQIRSYPGPGTTGRAHVQPELGSEFNEARAGTTIQMRVYTRDVDLAALDRVLFLGDAYDVVGPARPYRPYGDDVHHYEATMVRVEG
jgi:hypothetical protein